ncbi:MAG TPA: polysaccharide deacetylase family protein, partial [Clostridia bacterium]|nr:polysaccharide deacetylase family protein [Clostridia bacterium]
MIFFVFNVRRFLLYLFLIAVTVFVLSIFSLTGMDALGVFTDSRELPIYSVEVPEKRVSITFDCAWGADDIPDILQTLKEANIKASFFIVGQWAEKFPDKVKQIARDGHDVSNHSYSHRKMAGLGRTQTASEIGDCGRLLERLSGRKCDLFRAPYGEYNNTLIKEASLQGYYSIQWDVDSLDWSPGISREEILRRVDSKVKNGSIILFHNDTPHTAKILPSVILDFLCAGGLLD